MSCERFLVQNVEAEDLERRRLMQVVTGACDGTGKRSRSADCR